MVPFGLFLEMFGAPDRSWYREKSLRERKAIYVATLASGVYVVSYTERQVICQAQVVVE